MILVQFGLQGRLLHSRIQYKYLHPVCRHLRLQAALHRHLAAVQRVAPNSMRGQVTAFYLFMFTFFGAMGSYVVGKVQDVLIGDPAQLWKALLITARSTRPASSICMALRMVSTSTM